MRNNLWIFLSFGFFLLAQGFPQSANKEQSVDADYPLDETDKDLDDNEDLGPAPVLRSKNASFIKDVGDTVSLPCHIDNEESAVVLWWFDKTILWTDTIPSGSISHPNFELQGDHSLVIHEIKANDTGIYNCSILHGEILQSVIYEIHVAGKPTITRTIPGEEKKIVEKGTPLTLMCEATGYPTPVISWTKKTKHNVETLEGTKVTIDSANRKHSGTYECKAMNSKGQDIKKIEIHVQYEPEVEVDNEIVYSGEGYESEIVCTVHGEPKAKVSWLKDDQPLAVAHHHITISDKGNKHLLRVSGTSKSDFGVYRCIGENVKGTNSKTITLTGKPMKPKFHAAELSSDSKSPILSWSIESFSPILSYELLYRIQDKDEWKTADVPVDGPVLPEKNKFIARHTLMGLEPGVYQAQLRAKNIFGWSELSDPHPFSENVANNSPEASHTGLLESAQNDHPSTASELRISFALVISLLIARYYC